jgi:hypothetical protein
VAPLEAACRFKRSWERAVRSSKTPGNRLKGERPRELKAGFSLNRIDVSAYRTEKIPREELTAVYMSQAPSPIRAYYRKLVKQLVYGALTD